jgi:hypothetical protein
MNSSTKATFPEKTLIGKVIRQKFAAVSKSEYDAVCIKTNGTVYVLKRMGGNPFNDPELSKLIGKYVKAVGHQDNYQFLARLIEEM